jgi:hypothetical protein
MMYALPPKKKTFREQKLILCQYPEINFSTNLPSSNSTILLLKMILTLNLQLAY